MKERDHINNGHDNVRYKVSYLDGQEETKVIKAEELSHHFRVVPEKSLNIAGTIADKTMGIFFAFVAPFYEMLRFLDSCLRRYDLSLAERNGIVFLIVCFPFYYFFYVSFLASATSRSLKNYFLIFPDEFIQKSHQSIHTLKVGFLLLECFLSLSTSIDIIYRYSIPKKEFL